MLILSRRIGERIMIGHDVAVTVLGVQGHQVRLGVDAPQEVAVHREEIYERIQNERRAAHVTGALHAEAVVDNGIAAYHQ